MERELRENLLGDDAWIALDPAARTFIATAEKIFATSAPTRPRTSARQSTTSQRRSR